MRTHATTSYTEQRYDFLRGCLQINVYFGALSAERGSPSYGEARQATKVF